MTQRNRDVIDQLYQHLVNAPMKVEHCTNREVLAALGMMVSGIMQAAYDDPITEAQTFCGALMASVDPAFKAKLVRQQRSSEMALN